MKKLIFLAILTVPSLVFSQTPQREVPTAEDGQAIVTQIKDVEVSQMISETAEFRECKDKYPFVATDNSTQRSDKLEEAKKCFEQKLKNNTDPERLKKLSEALDLQSYKLVKSNSAKEVQTYLTNKMIHALTGVDPAERDKQKMKENLKFGKKKMVDQSIFIQLYKTQLGKNALYEISRFCFEDLRNKNGPQNVGFYEHWKSNQTLMRIDRSDPQTITTALNDLNDLGVEKFGSFSDTSDKSKIYADIFKNIQGNASQSDKAKIQQFLEKYFLNCGFMMEPLCNQFKSTANETNTDSKIDIGSSSGTTSNGAAACLALNRIREYKKAIANAEKVSEYMDQEMQGGGTNLAAFMKGLNGEPIKRFGDGSDSREATVDELTNNTASSFLDGNLEDQIAQDKAKECEESPELAKCEGLVYKTEDLDKIKQKIELDQTLKREVEMQRVRKLVEGNRQDLETYLKENGFFEILQSDDFKNMDKDKLVAAVGKSFEAKKLAMLNEINSRLGSRQVKDEQTLQNSKPLIQTAQKESKEERARLAQMVLFNNIITSHLSLQKRDSSGKTTSAGRNLGAWKKEEQALEQDSVDASLFENLKATDPSGGNGGGIGRDAQIADFSLLDDILGKEATP